MDFDHILVTRFNINVYDGGITRVGHKYDPQEWMIARLQLLHKYCAPSIAAQSVNNFRWLITVDVRTPEDILADLVRDKSCVILPCTLENQKYVVQSWVKDNVTSEWLISTRVDSDDALHRLHMQDLQENARECRELLCFPRGWNYRYPENTLHTVFWHGSGFITLVEPTEGAVTSMSSGHNHLRRLYPYRALPGRRWLRTIHETNNTHYARGNKVVNYHDIDKVSLTTLMDGFPAIKFDEENE